MNNKKLTWGEIEYFLKKELDKTKHIMTFGTIGSLNLEHDIDTIITKKPNSQSSKFFKEVHNIFDNLSIFLKNDFNFEVRRFARLSDEYIIKNITKMENTVFFHSMIYVSLPEIEKDWAWSIFPDENMGEILKKHYKCLLGKVDDLFSTGFRKTNYCDNIFTYLYLNDFIQSGFEENMIVSVMNPLFDYLYRKRLCLKYVEAKDLQEIKKRYYSLCDLADKLNKEKLK